MSTADQHALLTGWEQDAQRLIANGLGEADRAGGHRLLENVAKWRKETTQP